MALILFDGFEALPAVRSDVSLSTGTTMTAVEGRDGVGKAAVGAGIGQIITYPVPSVDTLIYGFGWFPLTSVSNLVRFYSGAGTLQLQFNIEADGRITIKRGSTTIQTSTLTISFNVWHYIEVKCTLADAGGIFIMKVDGVEFLNFTGDTRNTGTDTQFTSVQTYMRASALNGHLDDVVILDGTGPAPYNDFIGERVVKAVRPAANGANSDWVGSDADSVDNYALVNKVTPDVTTYVGATTPGDKDTYDFGAVSGLASVDAVQVAVYAQKSDSGSKLLKTVAVDGVDEVQSGIIPLSTTPQLLVGTMMQTAPDGGAWTQAKVNSAEYGVVVDT